MQALIPDTLWEIGGLAATIYSIGQARQHHHEQLEQSKKHHEVEMDLAIKQHKKNLVETKRVYLLELFTNLEQHFQQLNADLIASGKEAERGMFDQRNQNFQTIILASSVMFTALSTVIIDGALPERTAEGLIAAFSLTSAFSFAFLFLSMVICMELVMRASSFMYRRARNHTEQLRRAIKDTKAMMEELRNGTRNHLPIPSSLSKDAQAHAPSQEEEDDQLSPAINLFGKIPNLSQRNNSTNGKLDPSLRFPLDGIQVSAEDQQYVLHRARKHRIISELDEEGLEREWKNHEKELQRFLAERERINDATALIGADEKLVSEHPYLRERLTTSNRKSFQEFWNYSCKVWAELSMLFFYGGTINLLLAIMVFMWAQFLHQYHSFLGAIIAISLITFTLVLGLCSVIGLRWMKLVELQYHPEEAIRRRVGNQRMFSFSSFNNGTYLDNQNHNAANNNMYIHNNDNNNQYSVHQRLRGQLSSQYSQDSSLTSFSRDESISYLPEFTKGGSDPEAEGNIIRKGSCRSEKFNKKASSSDHSHHDHDNDEGDSELQCVSPISTPSQQQQQQSRRGIVMPSTCDSDFTCTLSPSTPPPHTLSKSQTLIQTNHSFKNSNNNNNKPNAAIATNLFRRYSPHNLFSANNNNYNRNSDNNLATSTPSHRGYGLSLVTPSPSCGSIAPPSTSSSTETTITSVDCYPPLPFSSTSGSVSRGSTSMTPPLSVSTRRAH